MVEENIKRVRCDRPGCPNKIEVEAKKGLLGIKNPKAPSGWGYDLEGNDQFCPECLKSYREGYGIWYTNWLHEKQNK